MSKTEKHEEKLKETQSKPSFTDDLINDIWREYDRKFLSTVNIILNEKDKL